MEYFPYQTARDTQKAFMEFLEEALLTKNNALIHAPTGIGKTAGVLAPTLAYSLKHHRTIFFVTSKHTQHAIVIETAKKIRERFGMDLVVADFIGKKWMCLQAGASAMESHEFAEYCREHVAQKTCSYYENIKHNNLLSINAKNALEHVRENIIPVEEVIQISDKEQVCPYEITGIHAQKAHIIIADYFHLLSPTIRDALLKRTGKELSRAVIIFDEAHNLPDRARDLLTSNTTTYVIEQAAKEIHQLGYEELSNAIQDLAPILEKLASRIPLQEHEALVHHDEFFKAIQELQDYEQFTEDIMALGDQILQDKKRSYAHSLGRFLRHWREQSNAFTRIITRTFSKKGKVNLILTHRCLDPSILLTPLAEHAHIICMSGTLAPTSIYKDLFGFNAITKELPDPFPQENRLNLIIPELTTRYTKRNEDMYKKIAGMTAALANAIPGNSVIFFPSYQLRDTIFPYFNKLCTKTIIQEHQNLNKKEREELLATFKSYKNTGAVLLAISNASFGEGIDLPGDYLKGVIIVGLPLAKPDLETKELIRYYDQRFGKGQDYGYIFPTLTKCLQNAGRCIRSSTDRGVIAFLDDRYLENTYKKFFPKEWKLQVHDDPVAAVKKFFS